MVPDADRRTIIDELDDARERLSFPGVYVDRESASTMRIHHVTLETPISPCSGLRDIVRPMLEAGDTFVCMSRFVRSGTGARISASDLRDAAGWRAWPASISRATGFPRCGKTMPASIGASLQFGTDQRAARLSGRVQQGGVVPHERHREPRAPMRASPSSARPNRASPAVR